MTTYSDDAIFHYTNADGLFGILTRNEIWSTAYFTTNDESELSAVEGILANLCKDFTTQLVSDNHEYVDLFRQQGINILNYPEEYERIWFDTMLEAFDIYITCFCRAKSELEYQDGLLSQWRGYGGAGGYALQFSHAKLTDWTTRTFINKESHKYVFHDVYYSLDNPFKEKVLEHEKFFLETYMKYLGIAVMSLQEPEKGHDSIENNSEFILPDNYAVPLSALLLYRIQTKNSHFSEERECRMSLFLEPLDDIEFFH